MTHRIAIGTLLAFGILIATGMIQKYEDMHTHVVPDRFQLEACRPIGKERVVSWMERDKLHCEFHEHVGTGEVSQKLPVELVVPI